MIHELPPGCLPASLADVRVQARYLAYFNEESKTTYSGWFLCRAISQRRERQVLLRQSDGGMGTRSLSE